MISYRQASATQDKYHQFFTEFIAINGTEGAYDMLRSLLQNVSTRQADLIDKLQPKVMELHGWAYTRDGKSYSIVYFVDDTDPRMINEVAQVLLGYDDFRRIEVSKEHTPFGYGYKSQDMENGDVVIMNLGEVVNGLKQIPGVEKVEMNRPDPKFIIRITYR